jgi:hypothetical protein
MKTTTTNEPQQSPAVACSAWLGRFASALAFAASMWSGVYLCLHDFPCLGGWVCILSLLGTWGFEKGKP